MTVNLDQLQRRGIALGVLLMLLLVAANVVVLPIIGYLRNVKEDREQSLHQLAKLQSLVDSAPAMKAELATIDSHPLWQRIYPSSGGSAALQQDFRQLIDSQQIKLDSVQPLEPVAEGGFQKITLRVSFTTTIDHLGHLLLALETAPHLLQMDNLAVSAPASQSDHINATLTVRGDVVGLAQTADVP